MRLPRALILAAVALSYSCAIAMASETPVPPGKRSGIVALPPARGSSLTIVPVRVRGSSEAPRITLTGARSLPGGMSIAASVIKLSKPRGAYLAVISSVNGSAAAPETVEPIRFRVRGPKEAELVVVAPPRTALLTFGREGARFVPSPAGSPQSFCDALLDANGPAASSTSVVETLAISRFSSSSFFGGKSARTSSAKALLVDGFAAADLACGNGSPSTTDVSSFVRQSIAPDFEYRGCGAPIAQPDGTLKVSCVVQIEQAPFQTVPTCGPDVETFCQEGVGGGSLLFKAFASIPDGATILDRQVIDLATGEFPAANLFAGQTWELLPLSRSAPGTVDVVVQVTDRNPFGVNNSPAQPATLRCTLVYR